MPPRPPASWETPTATQTTVTPATPTPHPSPYGPSASASTPTQARPAFSPPVRGLPPASALPPPEERSNFTNKKLEKGGTWNAWVDSITCLPRGSIIVEFKIHAPHDAEVHGATHGWFQNPGDKVDTPQKMANWRRDLANAYAYGGWLDTTWDPAHGGNPGDVVAPFYKFWNIRGADRNVPVMIELVTRPWSNGGGLDVDGVRVLNAPNYVEAPLPRSLPKWLAQALGWRHEVKRYETANGAIVKAMIAGGGKLQGGSGLPSYEVLT